MTERAEELLREALKLADDDRADVAAELLASLDGSPDVDAESAWAEEIARRARRVLAGETKSSDWNEVRQRLEDKLRTR